MQALCRSRRIAVAFQLPEAPAAVRAITGDRVVSIEACNPASGAFVALPTRPGGEGGEGLVAGDRIIFRYLAAPGPAPGQGTTIWCAVVALRRAGQQADGDMVCGCQGAFDRGPVTIRY